MNAKTREEPTWQPGPIKVLQGGLAYHQVDPPELAKLRTALDQIDQGGRPLPPARIAAEVLRIGETLLAKNADYGSSAHKPPALAPHLDPGAAILVRMSDKIARIVSLTQPGATPRVDESLDDTFRDLAGYCVLWLTRGDR